MRTQLLAYELRTARCLLETKEQLGGVGIIEAKDLNEAIALWSKHPAMVFDETGFEIRPIVDMTALREASKQRRKAAGKS